MSSAVVPGPSSSCSAAFTRNHSSRSSPKLFSPQCQKTPFQGLSLLNAKGGVIAGNRRSFSISRRRFEVTARTAGSSKNIEVDVDKPLGVTLGQKPGGGVVITAVEGGGNASKAGLRAGDQVLYTSSFFGDELWPADKLGFTKTAIQAKPDSVYFVVSRSPNPEVTYSYLQLAYKAGRLHVPTMHSAQEEICPV
ncbi:rubredoxin family protein [Actinidia rufa]|uniref:Rubredoxin family protein n=1 Tax=Actinidia rufa TaxID=165716 RepID=A0A7J0E5W3_9ERIC|nr:rubredoxin family protein [Actinidia rufa]